MSNETVKRMLSELKPFKYGKRVKKVDGLSCAGGEKDSVSKEHSGKANDSPCPNATDQHVPLLERVRVYAIPTDSRPYPARLIKVIPYEAVAQAIKDWFQILKDNNQYDDFIKFYGDLWEEIFGKGGSV